ncbi:hypothetical protein K1719_030445 [Acacia pycnantha]|nr:hypothetical protein K1719_030445 [Acacia pycnantha]
MISWAIELSEFDITYEARHAIKSQALADFLERTNSSNEDPETDLWKVYVDGSSHSKGTGRNNHREPEGVTIEHSLQLDFPTSNNRAEYARSGRTQRGQGARRTRVSVFMDSQLAAARIDGTYRAKGPLMAKYLSKVKNIRAEFEEVKVTHIPRGENVRSRHTLQAASTKGTTNHNRHTTKVTDNGTRFTDEELPGYDGGPRHHTSFASVEHPQSNGRAKRQTSYPRDAFPHDIWMRSHDPGRSWSAILEKAQNPGGRRTIEFKGVGPRWSEVDEVEPRPILET